MPRPRVFQDSDLLGAIDQGLAQNGYAPTVRELAVALQVSPTAVARRLNLLRAQGLVAWDDGKFRTLKVLA